MEVLLLALFFISTLIFFISGKDDFGRNEKKKLMQESDKIKENINFEPSVEVKKQA